MVVRNVSNAVLLERINQLKESQDKTDTAIEKLDGRLTQNFDSMANVLKEGYVKKDDIRQMENDISELKRTKVDEAKMRPYIYVWNTIGALALTGFVALIGKMIYDYVRGGPPL